MAYARCTCSSIGRDSYNSYATGEDTLRLIASLPAPEKLAGRVNAGLRAAPQSSRTLMWRGSLLPSMLAHGLNNAMATLLLLAAAT